jgi:tRNA (adenine37-N6)-methyltransferase
MMKSISMSPIGIVHSSRKDVEDDNWDAEQATVELDSNLFSEEALLGLSNFSHVEIVFHMDRVDPSKIEKVARHPRNNAAWPAVGIFAQRGKNRPNQIGTTICKIVNVEGRNLQIAGLDAVDGTPVLDIKPWVKEFAPRGQVFQPDWISELMRGYWDPSLKTSKI